VLEVSAIGFIDRVWVCLEPPERVCETSQTQKLWVELIIYPIETGTHNNHT